MTNENLQENWARTVGQIHNKAKKKQTRQYNHFKFTNLAN